MSRVSKDIQIRFTFIIAIIFINFKFIVGLYDAVFAIFFHQ